MFDPFFALGALGLLLLAWALARSTAMRELAARRTFARRRPRSPRSHGDALEHALETAADGDQVDGDRGERSRGEREAATWPGFGPVLEVDAPSFLPPHHFARVGRKGRVRVDLDRFPAPVLRHVFLLGLERALADACAGSDSLEPARWLVAQWRAGRLAKPGEARWRRDAR